MKLLRFIFLAFALCSLPACVSNKGGGLFSWWTHRGERATEKANADHEAAREAQLVAARIEAEKAAQSAAALPPSPEATLTQRFTGNTSDLLSQAVPGVTAEQLAAVRQLVADLRSEDAKVVAAAEARQRATERHNSELSRELAEAAGRVAAAEAKAAQIAEKNADLAASLLWMKFAAAAGTIGTVVAGALAVMYRSNAFGIADGVARGLADLRRNQPGVADLATAALDTGLDRAEQTRIARAFQTLAPDLAAR